MKYSHLLLASMLLAGSSLQAQTIYGSDVSLDSLGTIDPGSGVWSLIGSQGIPSGESINGMAYDNVNDVLYGVNTATDELVTMNTASGLASTVGGTSGGQFNGLAYNSNLGVLYSMTTTDQLYSINPGSGASTFIGGGNVPDQIEGMAYDAIADRLFGLNGQGQVFSINTSTGTATALPNSIGTSGLWRGLTWDGTNQQLLASIVGGSGQLWSVDPVTGSGVLIGGTTNFAQGLATEGGPLPPPFVYNVPFLVAGTTATFSYSGAVPFGDAYMLYSLNGAGPTNTVVGPLDLSSPILVLDFLPADSLGNGSTTVFVPPSASGRTLYTQAVTWPASQVSNSYAVSVQ